MVIISQFHSNRVEENSQDQRLNLANNKLLLIWSETKENDSKKFQLKNKKN